MTTTANDDLAFLVGRKDFHATRWSELPAPSTVELARGQAILAVDAFAFTANNVTYAVFGEMMNYWKFFPAPEGWGTVPVWGFATVARSNHADLPAGERVYGYLPMSSYFVATVDRVTPSGFSEVSPHRLDLPAIYNQYSRTRGDAAYDARHEAEQMLFRPLFLTGFLIDDFLASENFFGARSVVLSSASSKTSIGLAFCLSRRGRESCEVVGLTSRANKEFVESLGCYHRVVAYDEIPSLPSAEPTVFVDMAGDGGVTTSVHEHFQGALRYSCSVGGTHWDHLAFGMSFPGPAPVLFFAPDHAARRLADWGPAGLQERTGAAWSSFVGRVSGWIRPEHRSGRSAIESVYLDTLDGRADPKLGYILSFRGEAKGA